MRKTTFIAIAVFAALLAAVLLTREDRVSAGVRELPLPPLGEVTSVEVSGASQAKLTLENGAWVVSGHRADARQVDSLLEALRSFRASEHVTDRAERQAELELDDARGTRVSVVGKSGAWQLVLGKAARSGGTYVRQAGSSAVFATSSPAAHLLKRGSSAWRDHSIATAAATDLAQVKVMRRETELTLSADGAGWKLEPMPAGFRFDPDAAQRLVQQLTSLRAQDFADGADATEPQATVELSRKDGTKVSLRLGASRPDGTVPLTVGGDPRVYLLARWTADQVMRTPDDLRDTRLFSFDPEKVARVRMSAGGKTTALAREGPGWKVLEPKAVPPGLEPDPAAVSQQLLAWKDLRAVRVVPGVTDQAAGLGTPSATLELSLEGGGKESLRLGGGTPSGEVYARGAVDRLVYAVAAGERAALERGLELFRQRPPPDLSHLKGLEQLPPEVRAKLEAQLREQQR